MSRCDLILFTPNSPHLAERKLHGDRLEKQWCSKTEHSGWWLCPCFWAMPSAWLDQNVFEECEAQDQVTKWLWAYAIDRSIWLIGGTISPSNWKQPHEFHRWTHVRVVTYHVRRHIKWDIRVVWALEALARLCDWLCGLFLMLQAALLDCPFLDLLS